MNILQRTVPLSSRLILLRESCIFRRSELLMKNNTRSFYPNENEIVFRAGPKKEDKFKRKDKMTSTAKLVYTNPFSFWIESGYHLLRLLIIIASSGVIYLVKLYSDNIIEVPYIHEGKVIVRSEKEIVVAISLSLFAIISSMALCKWSVLRIYFDRTEKVSKAIVVGSLPFKRKIITIKPASVSPVMRRFPVPYFRTFEYQIDRNKMLLYDDYFRTPADLNRMLKFLH